MHKRNVLHRDIKSDNVLLNKHGIKIADLNHSVMLTKANILQGTKFPGFKNCRAPEMMKRQRYDLKVDIWGMGTIMYEIGAGHIIWEEKDEMSLLQAIQNPEEVVEVEGRSEEFNQLMKMCLLRDPIERPDIESVLNHEYLQGAENLQNVWDKYYERFRQDEIDRANRLKD